MVDYTITNVGTATGAVGADKLTYTVNVAGGVTLTGMTGSLAAGYAGQFNGPGTNDGNFTGIENFAFVDAIGGNDNINTLDGADSLNGGAGNDTLNSGAGNDTIIAGTGSDSINAGAGIDSITVTLDGTDVVDGGTEVDTLTVAGGTTAVIMTSGTTITTTGATITYSNVENFNITGSTVNDNIVTGAGADSLFGGTGDDTLTSGTGSDSVNGGAGIDLITVGLDGTDTVDGGTEFDTLVVVGGATAVTMTSGTTIVTTGATITYSNMENFNITGSSVADTITTGTGNDTLNGGAGNDTLNSGTGNDSINGGANDDLITVGLGGTDVVDGGADNDTLVVVGGVDAITMTSGTTITATGATITYSNIEKFNITGSSAADTITTGANNDTINGGAGNDTINSGAGSDSINGGANDDVITVTLDGGDTVDGGADTDTLVIVGGAIGITMTTASLTGPSTIAISNIEKFNVTGSSAADNITTGTGNDTISTAAGNDTINSGSGSDTVFGGAGDDSITFTVDGTDSIDGGADNDTLTVVGTTVALTMTPTSITGPGTATLVNFEQFNVTGSTVNDNITTGVGADTINGGDGNDTLSSDAGNDIVNAGTGNDSVSAGNGDDTVITGTGSDTVLGGAGNDTITVTMDGTDVIDGGADTDVLIVTGASTVITMTGVTGGAGSITGAGTLTFTGFEQINITGSTGNDNLVAGDQNDTLNGANGNDTLNGAGGSDSINGGSGNDTITLVVDGTDTVDGGADTDTLVITGTTTALIMNGITAGAGTITGPGTVGFINIEQVNITGSTANDSLVAGDGNDTLNGGIGDDTLNGGAGADTLTSGVGSDSVLGGAGDDLLTITLDGSDVVDGGADSDVLIVANTVSGGVTLTDMTGGAGLMSGPSASTITFTGIERLNFTGAATGDDSIVSGAGNDTLNGNGGNDTLNAGTGNDSISGGVGNDVMIVGLDGSDFVYGGSNTDTLVITSAVAGAVTMTGPSGSLASGYDGSVTGPGSAIVNYAGIENFSITTGASGNDSIQTGNGNDTIVSNDGNDDLFAVKGSDSVSAGDGNDTITVFMDGTDVIDGGAGIDVLNLRNLGVGTIINFSNVTGSLATGYSGTATTSTGATFTYSGIERFEFFTELTDEAPGSVTFNSGDGADFIRTANAVDVINAGGGNNEIRANGGNDSITSGSGTDSIDAGSGNDVINSGSGNDSVEGGDGLDLWISDQSSRTTALDIDMNSASRLAGTSTAPLGSIIHVEAMQITSGSGNDTLVGHDFSLVETLEVNLNDRLSSGAGTDTLKLWMGGQDTVDGGADSDVLTITAKLTSAVTSTMDSLGAVTFGATYLDGLGNSVVVSNMERLLFTGSDQADYIVAGNGKDTLRGGAGNDTINGAKGLDSVDGGLGNDTWIANTTGSTRAMFVNVNNTFAIYQGTGVLRNVEGLQLTTGAGSDNIKTHATIAMNDILNTASGNDFITTWLKGADVYNMGAGQDNLIVNGNAAGVVFDVDGSTTGVGFFGTATSGTNTLTFTGLETLAFNGGTGADDILAAAGADRLHGGGGNDLLNASSGSDRLWGDDGNDTITGGTGNDFMYGGAGADVFVFSRTASHGLDRIYDFNTNGDKIQIVDGSFAASVKSVVGINNNTDTLITLNNGTKITLDDVVHGTINASDFLFT